MSASHSIGSTGFEAACVAFIDEDFESAVTVNKYSVNIPSCIFRPNAPTYPLPMYIYL